MIGVIDWSEIGHFEVKIWESLSIAFLREIEAIFVVKIFQG